MPLKNNMPTAVPGSGEIRSRPAAHCYLCGKPGTDLYQGLQDRLFDAPGKWNFKRCSDAQCGLLWLDPLPLEEEIFKAYQTYFTHQNVSPGQETWLLRMRNNLRKVIKEKYLSQVYGYQEQKPPGALDRLLALSLYLKPGQRAEVDYSVMYLPAQWRGRLLDVGCGSGWLLQHLQGLGWEVEGLDVDPAAVENARSKGLRVSRGALEEQRYPDNHFDVITMSHLIEHVHDPLRLMRESHRILKEGGRLILTTPNHESLGHRLFKESWLALEPPRHLYIFSSASLRTLSERAGFGKNSLCTSLRGANELFIACRFIRRSGRFNWGGSQPRPLRLWGRLMLLVEFLLMQLRSDLGEEIVLMAEK